MEMIKNGQPEGKEHLLYKEFLLMLGWEPSYCADQFSREYSFYFARVLG